MLVTWCRPRPLRHLWLRRSSRELRRSLALLKSDEELAVQEAGGEEAAGEVVELLSENVRVFVVVSFLLHKLRRFLWLLIVRGILF